MTVKETGVSRETGCDNKRYYHAVSIVKQNDILISCY